MSRWCKKVFWKKVLRKEVYAGKKIICLKERYVSLKSRDKMLLGICPLPPKKNVIASLKNPQGGAKIAQGGAKNRRALRARMVFIKSCPPLGFLVWPPLHTETTFIKKTNYFWHRDILHSKNELLHWQRDIL